MKKNLLLLIAIISTNAFAQNPQLIPNDWYLQTLVIDGQTYETPIEPYYTRVNFTPEAINIDYVLCDEIATTLLYYYDESEFILHDSVSFGFGCDPPALQWYTRQKQFYNPFKHSDVVYPYSISEADGELLLLITNGLGDQAFYSNVALNTKDLVEGKLLVYPNPADDVVMFSGIDDISEVAVFDVFGKKMAEIRTEDNSVDVSRLQSGVYFITITSQSGLKTTRKIIKR